MAQNNYFIDSTGDGKYDTIVGYSEDYIFSRQASGGKTNHQKVTSYESADIDAHTKKVAEQLAETLGGRSIGSEMHGANFGKEVEERHNLGAGEGGTDYKMGDQYAGEEYGAPTLTREDFFNADGSQKDPNLIAAKLKAAGAKGSEKDILRKVLETMPKLEEVEQEEQAFVAEQYGGATGLEDDPSTPVDESKVSFAESMAGKTAGASREADMYGLQKQAAKVGGAMQNVYGGMAGGARQAIAGQTAIGKGAEKAYDKYGLAEEKADFAGRKATYGLEKAAYGDFESDITSTFFAKGGRVPNKDESFLSFLTQLPDAGGM